MSDQLRLRMTLLGILILGLFVALVARLWYLQVVSQETFEVQARAQLERTVAIPAPRGRILDVNGRVLVGNRVTNLVSIDKYVLEEKAPTASAKREIAVSLAREISQTGRLIKAQAIEDAFNDPKYGAFDSIPIATDVTEEFAILLGERLDDFPGVEVSPTTVREYPFGQVASHVLGYIGPVVQKELDLLTNHPKPYSPNDEIGKAGIERSFEDVLRGTPGRRVIEVDAQQRVVAVLEESDPIPGSDVQLTIDVDIQRMVEEELRIGVEGARTRTVVDLSDPDAPPSKELYRSTGGAMVLLDAEGSRVVAMASYPTYNLELFIGGISEENWELLREDEANDPLVNRAIAGAYSPGSTFKPFTSYAAMDTGLLGDRGFLEVGEFTLDEGVYWIPDCEGPTSQCRKQNAGRTPFGSIDLREAITVSSDVYYYQLAYQFDVRAGFDANSIQQAASLFGFGRATGIQLPEDYSGQVPDADFRTARHEANPEAFPNSVWRAGDTLNVSIGQGDVHATPLQVANAYAVIANGGTLYAPQLVDRIIDPVTDEPTDVFGARVVDELYLPDWMRDPIVNGLIGVIDDEDGTAYEVFEDFPLSEYSLAGKTGTVENKPQQDSSAFVAYGPVEDPEYVIFAFVEEGGFGAHTAAPMVRSVMGKIQSGDIIAAPTAAEVEEYYRNTLLAALEDEESAPTGDITADIARGLDIDPDPTSLPTIEDSTDTTESQESTTTSPEPTAEPTPEPTLAPEPEPTPEPTLAPEPPSPTAEPAPTAIVIPTATIEADAP